MSENPRWDFTVSLQSQILLTNKKSGNRKINKGNSTNVLIIK